MDKGVVQQDTQLTNARIVRWYSGKQRARKISQAVAVFQESAFFVETTSTSNGRH
jgi:hypothetical protein